MKRRSWLVLLGAAALATSMVAPSVQAAGNPRVDSQGVSGYTDGRYIVTFVDEPVASYTGYKARFPATKPKAGRKINPNSPAVQKWQRHLTAKQDAALAKVGATKIYGYTVTNNGVAANLTAEQATKLARMKGVVSVQLDELAKPDTTSSPEYLGLTQPGGLWAQLAGIDPRRAGAGQVVGVLDTGIWPESAAFRGGTGIPVPADWHGTCVAGQNFPKTSCNDKLIGARYYVGGFGKKNISKGEYLSPRDGDGHGSHTASTAAGNYATRVSIDGNVIDDGLGSGMAPGAKVAAYKVCWTGKPGIGDGCFSSDSVAAINDAVLDGVDVINYSIGGGSESDVFDPVAQAFRAASNAGVFVATSAGNSGPGSSTFDHPAPWVTTVAAVTFRQAFQVVELGNGSRYLGASTTASLPTATPFVTSLSVKVQSAPDSDARLCAPGSLDPAKAAGKVVQCDRGVYARIDKSFEVARAGGVGMVMTNTSPNSINGDYHAVPSVHLDSEYRTPVLDYIAAAGANATARIVAATPDELEDAPQTPEIAAFSSRGPSTTTAGDILKPDIAAPGVDVVAAVAPPFTPTGDRAWDFMSGTSMASPHIAGIGALLKALHPTWLPSEIKSALMTTTIDTVSSADDPFAQGAGFVNPNGAANPGLVYPTTANEYRGFLISLGAQFAPPFDTLAPITASNLNQPSIAIGKLAGTESVTRRVKNVGSSTATYETAADVPGFDVTVSPDEITLAPGAEATFTVTFTRDDAPLGHWAIGSLTWTDGSHGVRSPIALEPVAVSAPGEVHGTGAAGEVEFDIVQGALSPLDLSISGLVAGTVDSDSVVSGPFDTDNPVSDAGTKHYEVTVPADTAAARLTLDASDDTADLDLFVYSEGTLVALSASGAADEEVTLVAPESGTYDIYVNGFATPGGSTSYDLYTFVVTSADAGNTTLSPDPVPAPASLGDPSTVTASWAGLDATMRYFGVIHYAGSDVVTMISVH